MKILDKILNILYPPVCGFCNKLNNNWLCCNCLNKINYLKISNIEDYQSTNFYFKQHFYLFIYDDEIRKQLINYKFNEKSYLYKTFSQLFKSNFKFKKFLSNYDCILSVPIHKKRMHSRGYNQSELIAKDIARYFGKPYYGDVLLKTENIIAQSTLSKEARQVNVTNVFSVQNHEKIINKKIIVLDDIFTTGATTNECAKMLINSGAAEVGIVTIAKD